MVLQVTKTFITNIDQLNSEAQLMISMPEILIIVIFVVLLFGPNKIPELARSMGKFMGEFTRAQREVEFGFRSQYQSTQSPGPKSHSKNERIREMAKSVDIITEGKSDEELLDEIETKLKAK